MVTDLRSHPDARKTRGWLPGDRRRLGIGANSVIHLGKAVLLDPLRRCTPRDSVAVAPRRGRGYVGLSYPYIGRSRRRDHARRLASLKRQRRL